MCCNAYSSNNEPNILPQGVIKCRLPVVYGYAVLTGGCAPLHPALLATSRPHCWRNLCRTNGASFSQSRVPRKKLVLCLQNDGVLHAEAVRGWCQSAGSMPRQRGCQNADACTTVPTVCGRSCC